MAKEIIVQLSEEQLHCLTMMRMRKNDPEEYGLWFDNLKKVTELENKAKKENRPWILKKLDDITGAQIMDGIITGGSIMLVFVGKDVLEKFWDPVAGNLATRHKRH